MRVYLKSLVRAASDSIMAFDPCQSRRRMDTTWKRMLLFIAIGLSIIVIHSSSRLLMEYSINPSTSIVPPVKGDNSKKLLKEKILQFPSIKESSKTPSTVRHPSCPFDDIVVNAESISLKVPKELEKVVPLWPNTRADKCIGNIKTKSRREFPSNKNASFNRCVEKNRNIKDIRADSLKRLDYSVTHSFFKELKKKPEVAVIEIGGYLGVLMPKLLKSTGAKKYVALEPVPSFYQQFTEKIKNLSLQSIVTAYNFGLGKTQKELEIGMRKEATSLLKNIKGKNGKTETIKIYNVINFFVQIGLGCNSLNLLTINCEGCEFDVIEMLTSTSLIDNIDYVQFQPHVIVFSDEQKYLCMFCRLRELLARTHELAYEYPHVWEAWKRKGLP